MLEGLGFQHTPQSLRNFFGRGAEKIRRNLNKHFDKPIFSFLSLSTPFLQNLHSVKGERERENSFVEFLQDDSHVQIEEGPVVEELSWSYDTESSLHECNYLSTSTLVLKFMVNAFDTN